MNDNVKSAVRVLDILEVLSTASQGLSLGEVTGLIGAPKSSTLMLLRTLTERSYLERDVDERYRMNPILTDTENGWIGGKLAVLIRRSQPVMRRLAASVRETCLLASLTPEGYVRLLAKVVSPREVRYDTDLSQLNPAYRTASGRVQLAHLNANALAIHIARWNSPERPEAERIVEGDLRADLEQVRNDGVALAIDLWEAGATGVSAPIFASGGQIAGAITVGAVTARFHHDREEILTATRRAADEISALMTAPHAVFRNAPKAAGRAASIKQQKGKPC